jgi:hypothetical protein
MGLHGAHPEALLGCVGGLPVAALRKEAGDGLQRQQVVAHVGQHVLAHGGRQLDQLP